MTMSAIQMSLLDLIVRRRNALFGHVAKLSEDTPAYQALCCQINLSPVALLLVSGDALLIALATSGWTRYTLTTTSHLLIFGGVPSIDACCRVTLWSTLTT